LNEKIAKLMKMTYAYQSAPFLVYGGQLKQTCSETEMPPVEEKERVGSLAHKNPKQDRLMEASALSLKYNFLSDEKVCI